MLLNPNLCCNSKTSIAIKAVAWIAPSEWNYWKKVDLAIRWIQNCVILLQTSKYVSSNTTQVFFWKTWFSCFFSPCRQIGNAGNQRALVFYLHFVCHGRIVVWCLFDAGFLDSVKGFGSSQTDFGFWFVINFKNKKRDYKVVLLYNPFLCLFRF